MKIIKVDDSGYGIMKFTLSGYRYLEIHVFTYREASMEMRDVWRDSLDHSCCVTTLQRCQEAINMFDRMKKYRRNHRRSMIPNFIRRTFGRYRVPKGVTKLNKVDEAFEVMK